MKGVSLHMEMRWPSSDQNSYIISIYKFNRSLKLFFDHLSLVNSPLQGQASLLHVWYEEKICHKDSAQTPALRFRAAVYHAVLSLESAKSQLRLIESQVSPGSDHAKRSFYKRSWMSLHEVKATGVEENTSPAELF